MSSQHLPAEHFEKLRKEAEKQVGAAKAWVDPKAFADPLALVHELEVHKIELEIQNKNLIDALVEQEAAHAKYQAVFDLSPCGHFVLSMAGEIQEANTTAAAMFGVHPQALAGRQFRAYFSEQCLPELEYFFTAARQTGMEVAFSKPLTIIRPPRLPLLVAGNARAFGDTVFAARALLVTLMDVTALKHAQDDVVKVIEKNADLDPR